MASCGSCYGAIETGGTKIICAIGSGPDDLERISFATTTPEETIHKILSFFRERTAVRPILAIGVGSFGPVDLHRSSPTFGFITSTPKPGWRNTDIVGPLSELHVPLAFDTDVNAAALGEAAWGAGRGLRNIVYVTAGTGIGGGALVNGEPLHGLVHPEMGHVRIPHDLTLDPFPGCCPFHLDCLEGLASGPAIKERCGRAADELPAGHPVWAVIARHLAFATLNWALTLSPQRIILGGGVMQQASLLPLIRSTFVKELNSYMQSETLARIDQYLVAPELEGNSGILGAIVLAKTRAQ